MTSREQVSIILVEPQNPGNVGMVCRAMKNMGLSSLRLVNPCPVQHPEARKFAVSAKDILESAEIFPTLRDALADVFFSVGTTRRFGKYRQEILSPREVARELLSRVDAGPVALVFGREDNGLSTEEISLCTAMASIETAGEYGSLNLAQAVLIFCYELHRERGEGVPRIPRAMASGAELESLFGRMEQTLLRIGFLNPENPDHIMRTLRRVINRSGVDSREVSILRGILSQIDWACDSFRGKK
ncbi:MAG: RNA methyltransferase [Desulfuromonadia bacterium]